MNENLHLLNGFSPVLLAAVLVLVLVALVVVWVAAFRQNGRR